MKNIVILNHDNIPWTDYLIRKCADELIDKGVKVKTNHVRRELVTPMVTCKFIPKSIFDRRPEKFKSITADEFFGFSDKVLFEHFHYRRSKDSFKGTFMDYILLMNKGGKK